MDRRREPLGAQPLRRTRLIDEAARTPTLERALRPRMPEDTIEENRESPPLHANDLIDKPVYDVNGLMLGRVTLARETSDHLLGFDVTLRERLRDRLDAPSGVVTVMPDLIVAADEEVTLSEAGEFILHPERMPAASHE